MNSGKLPTAIGVIMDGNRRWAKEKGLPQLQGHRIGFRKIEKLLKWAKEGGIRYLTVYAFSTENWNRPKDEVAYLMDLFRKFVREYKTRALKENVRVRFIGQIDRFPEDIQKEIQITEKDTKKNNALTLLVALSYGGRAELINAFKKIKASGVARLTEDILGKYLWTDGVPDPDIIIRTGGEKRLSNFLMWQGAYSELFFTDTYWPEFSKKEFNTILDTYAQRERRHGK